MARPVVVSAASAQGLEANEDQHYLAAADADEFATKINWLIADAARRTHIGASARLLIKTRYGWPAKLARLDRWLGRPGPSLRDDRHEVEMRAHIADVPDI